MTDPHDHRIGLLADPHVHATRIPGIDGPAPRPLAEVMASSSGCACTGALPTIRWRR